MQTEKKRVEKMGRRNKMNTVQQLCASAW